jgi:hypothetical protein
MLREYAVLPDIFDSSCYSLPDLCGIHLQNLKESLLQEVLVRDLRQGGWSTFVREQLSQWHPRAKELFKKLVQQRRLRPSAVALPISPSNYTDWCHEALASHRMDPLTGIICSNCSASSFPDCAEVASIERLSNTPWWQCRSPSLRLERTTQAYLKVLRRIFTHANSLMFIDLHLDPSRYGYREITHLFQASQRTGVPPALIEIHRVCYVGSGRERRIIPTVEWERIFRQELSEALRQPGIQVNVYIWDDFHDRYLITDLIGISMPNGFDISGAPNEMTTWTRLGRLDKDDIQREFDPASGRHRLIDRFQVG